jgi:hypothetical protein
VNPDELWLWYTPGPPFATPVGVYDHASPEDAEPALQSVQLADADSVFAGVGALLREVTRARDALERFKDRILGL